MLFKTANLIMKIQNWLQKNNDLAMTAKYFLLRKIQIAIFLWYVREARLMYQYGNLQSNFEKKSQEYFVYCQDQS